MFSDSMNQIAERHPLWTLALLLRIPLLVVFGYTLLVFDLLISDATYDAVRFVVLDRPDQMAMIGLLLFIACFAIRSASDTMIAAVAPSLAGAQEFPGWIVWIAPRLLGSALALVTGLKFLTVATDIENFDLGNAGAAAIAQAEAAGAGIIYVLLGLGVAALPSSNRPRFGVTIVARIANLHWSEITILIALLVTAVSTFFLFWDWTNVAPAQFVGPFGVVLLWAFAAVMYFMPIALLAHITRVPWILVLVAAAGIFSALNLNDNHQVRTVTVPATSGPNYYSRWLDLADWLYARRDKDLYDYDHYPVFIVAAEGGALRSAYATARTLQAIQEICPGFASHIFAISGVSGGSIGAASFVASNLKMPESDIENPRPCAIDQSYLAFTNNRPLHQVEYGRAIKHLYSQDLMSPLLGAALFPDAAQRILPLAIDSFDRTLALECAFDRALGSSLALIDPTRQLDSTWNSEVASDRTPVACQGNRTEPVGLKHGAISLQSLYSGTRQTKHTPPLNVPYLFFATTSVDNGAIVPIASRKFGFPNVSNQLLPTNNSTSSPENDPFAFWSVQSRSEEFANGQDFLLSSAAFLSARFPFITPPGSLTPLKTDRNPFARNADPKLRYTDGGVFENSGVWLATEIANWQSLMLQLAANAPGIVNEISDIDLEQDPRFTKALLNARIHILIVGATPCEEFAEVRGSAAAGNGCHSENQFYVANEGLHELGSPSRALYRTRTTRGYEAITRLKGMRAAQTEPFARAYDACRENLSVRITDPILVRRECTERSRKEFAGHRYAPAPIEVSQIRLVNDEPLYIPLSWVISSRVRHLIDSAVSDIQAQFWPANASANSAHGRLRIRQGPLRFDLPNSRTGLEVAKVVCALHLTKQRKADRRPINDACRDLEPEWLISVDPAAWANQPEPAPVVVEPNHDPPPTLPELDRCEDCAPKKP
jgi:hypothetical protein